VKNKIKSILFYYYQLSIVNIAISLIAAAASYLILKEFAAAFVQFYLLYGFIIAFLVFEVRNKNSYYFYYNLGLSKIAMIFVSVVINIIVVSFVLILLNLIK